MNFNSRFQHCSFNRYRNASDTFAIMMNMAGGGLLIQIGFAGTTHTQYWRSQIRLVLGLGRDWGF